MVYPETRSADPFCIAGWAPLKDSVAQGNVCFIHSMNATGQATQQKMEA